tara:strand:+ start:4548 stop:5528 length:981 start_codon:yes stop_codon:yes gene_type:complete
MSSRFKEFNKQNISDERRTFEHRVTNKLDELQSKTIDEMSDYLLDIAPLIKEYYEDDTQTSKENDNEKFYMGDFVKSEKLSKKGEICKKYMAQIEGKGEYHEHSLIKDICEKCKEPYIINTIDSTCICTKCGECKSILLGEEVSNFSQATLERVEITPYYAYKRSNHFNEWLSQFQAKQTTTIPQEIFEQIILELKKERITDPHIVTPAKIKGYLKKLKYNKYYEHIPYIITKIQNKQAPKLTLELEEKLRTMFQMIQEPFHKHCPKDRKNFLSYSYTLHKFCELLGRDDLLICFPLLKSREKLHVQDIIWRGICKDLGWEYYPSI